MSKYITLILTSVFLLATAGAAFSQSQSLAEFAKKEKERREKVTAAQKAITNEDTSKYKAASISTGGMSVAPEAPKKEGDAEGGKAGAAAKTDEPTDFEGRPESFWRQTFGDARQKVQDLENESKVIVLKLTDLQNEFYKEASGFRQQELQKEIQKKLYEQDKNKEELAKAKDSLQDLEKEARKSGVLPGWMSGKKP